jgi:hypothetical protein
MFVELSRPTERVVAGEAAPYIEGIVLAPGGRRENAWVSGRSGAWGPDCERRRESRLLHRSMSIRGPWSGRELRRRLAFQPRSRLSHALTVRVQCLSSISGCAENSTIAHREQRENQRRPDRFG